MKNGRGVSMVEGMMAGYETIEGETLRLRVGTMRMELRAVGRGLLTGLLMLAGLLVARPYAETGSMDDWAYKQMASVYARTGALVYNGWPTVMAGWQIPYAAWFMHRLGDSYFAARLSTWLLGLLVLVLFQLCAGRAGLRERHALLAGLLLVGCPLFLPLANSVMTDMGSLAVLLLCLYGCQRALVSATVRGAVVWLGLAAVTNVALGTIRQIAWLGVLLMVPTVGWLLRRRRGVLLWAAALWACGGVAVWLSLRWLARQPYAVPDSKLPRVTAGVVVHGAAEMGQALLCLLLLLVPVLVAWLPGVARLRGRRLLGFAGSVVATLLVLAVGAHRGAEKVLMPWLQHVLDGEGVWPWIELQGAVPTVLGLKVRLLLSAVVLVVGLAFLFQLGGGEKRLEAPGDGFAVPWPAMRTLLLVYLAGYGCLLLPRAAATQLFDRYLFCVLPMVLLLVFHAWEARHGERMTVWVPAAIALYGVYTVMALHDTFASLRAEVEVLARLKAAGVERRFVDGGWISNGQAQLEMAGHLMSPLVEHPASPPYHDTTGRPPECRTWFDPYVAGLTFRYVVVWAPVSCYDATGFAPVEYRTWLPPFEHRLLVEKVRPAEGSLVP